MELFRCFKQIYCGKNALAKHISLFSIIGILMIFFIKYTASWGNLFVYNNFYISVPTNDYELWFYLFAGIFIFIYLVGYGLNLMFNLMNDRKPILPEVSLYPLVFFVRTLPLALYWILYYLAVCIAGLFVLYNFKLPEGYYIFASIMICMLPFGLGVFALFSKDNKYSKEYFSALTVFKVFKKTLGEVISFSIGIFAAALFPMFFIYKFLTFSPENVQTITLALKLFGVCLSGYLFVIFHYVYLIGITNIVKKKFLN